MGDQDRANVQGLVKDYPGPPAYTEGAVATPFQQCQDPPDYESQASTSIVATSSPYRPFPSIMNAYYQWTAIKTFNLCGASQDDRLCIVEMHTGYSGKKPLGWRPGLLLHNGMSTKDPILAAAGDESQLAARAYAFNADSVILLPPLEPRMINQDMTTEMMRASARGNQGVSFLFSIEVGERLQRERFEWRKFEKSDGEAKGCGFELVRLSSSSNQIKSSGGGDSSSQGDTSSPLTDKGYEAVAVMTLGKTWTMSKHAFSLQLIGSALSGALGERWALTVIITALRLWMLNIKGRTNRNSIAMGEKIRAK